MRRVCRSDFSGRTPEPQSISLVSSPTRVIDSTPVVVANMPDVLLQA